MKIRDLVNKCGLASTEFDFYICANKILTASAAKLRDDFAAAFTDRTVGTFRVQGDRMIVYIKPTDEEYRKFTEKGAGK